MQAHGADALADRNLDRDAGALEAARGHGQIGRLDRRFRLRLRLRAGIERRLGRRRWRQRGCRGRRGEIAGYEETVARRDAGAEAEFDAGLRLRQQRSDEVVEGGAVELEAAIVERELRARRFLVERA